MGLLLGWGADPRREVAGLTPIGLACAGGHLATVRLLLRWGAVFSGLNSHGARCGAMWLDSLALRTLRLLLHSSSMPCCEVSTSCNVCPLADWACCAKQNHERPCDCCRTDRLVPADICLPNIVVDNMRSPDAAGGWRSLWVR